VGVVSVDVAADSMVLSSLLLLWPLQLQLVQ
jgi:hypothetical protein